MGSTCCCTEQVHTGHYIDLVEGTRVCGEERTASLSGSAAVASSNNVPQDCTVSEERFRYSSESDTMKVGSPALDAQLSPPLGASDNFSSGNAFDSDDSSDQSPFTLLPLPPPCLGDEVESKAAEHEDSLDQPQQHPQPPQRPQPRQFELLVRKGEPRARLGMDVKCLETEIE